jgi:hypothetical protein
MVTTDTTNKGGNPTFAISSLLQIIKLFRSLLGGDASTTKSDHSERLNEAYKDLFHHHMLTIADGRHGVTLVTYPAMTCLPGAYDVCMYI